MNPQDQFPVIAFGTIILLLFVGMFVGSYLFGSESDWGDHIPGLFERMKKRRKGIVLRMEGAGDYQEFKGKYRVDVLDESDNWIKFRFNKKVYSIWKFDNEGKQVVFSTENPEALVCCLTESSKILPSNVDKRTSQSKKKGTYMPRILKWIFWIMVLILLWKLISHSDQIVVFLAKRFLGGV